MLLFSFFFFLGHNIPTPSLRKDEESNCLSTTGPPGEEGDPSGLAGRDTPDPDSPGEGSSAGWPTGSQENPGSRQPSRMTLWRRRRRHAEEDRHLMEKNQTTGFGSFGSPGEPCIHCGLARTFSQGHAFFLMISSSAPPRPWENQQPSGWRSRRQTSQSELQTRPPKEKRTLASAGTWTPGSCRLCGWPRRGRETNLSYVTFVL